MIFNLNLEYLKKITKVVKFYSGLHNKTYIGYLNGDKVQIRITQNKFVNWTNEEKVVKYFSNTFLFYKKGNFIKKWIDGNVLTKKDLVKHTNLLFSTIKNFHKLKIFNLEKFDWFLDNINDFKYFQLVDKYKEDNLVVVHCDLQFKNIIINETATKTKIDLIDFEWVRLGSEYIDFVCLHLNLNIDKSIIIDYFELDSQKFDDYLYMMSVFVNFWNKKYYN